MRSTEKLAAGIRGKNQGVYRESPNGLGEDASQEADIAQDHSWPYADGAMLGRVDGLTR
jgi:hypothetical protein